MNYSSTISYTILIALYCTTLHATKNDPHDPPILLQKFIEKYAPPKHICQIIDSNIDAILKVQYRFFLISGNIWAKGRDICRLINAERMRACIKKYNLDCLDIAQKYIYNINGEWRLLVEYIEGIEPSHITDRESRQINVLERETGFVDYGINNLNWLRTPTGKIVFIDTENLSFDTNDKLSAPNSDRFDDPNMNFEEVKELLKKFDVLPKSLKAKL